MVYTLRSWACGSHASSVYIRQPIESCGMWYITFKPPIDLKCQTHIDTHIYTNTHQDTNTHATHTVEIKKGNVV